MKTEDEFNSWNILKQEIDSKESRQTNFPNTQEVWMCNLGKNIGYEQNGCGNSFSRPVLIIKKFNNHMYWVVPLSTKQKIFDFYYNFIDPYKQKVSVITAQIKLMSIKRMRRKMYIMNNEDFFNTKDLIKNMIN